MLHAPPGIAGEQRMDDQETKATWGGNEMNTTIAVAGATGRVGRHIVAVLEERGHTAVPISRSAGINVITGDGLADALAGAACVIDAATGPSPEQQAATEFF